MLDIGSTADEVRPISREDWQVFSVMLDLIPEGQNLKAENWVLFDRLFESADRLDSKIEEGIMKLLSVWDNKLFEFGGRHLE